MENELQSLSREGERVLVSLINTEKIDELSKAIATHRSLRYL